AAEYDNATATVGCLTAGSGEVLSITVPPHGVAGGENLSVNDHEGPCTVPIGAGKYTLRQTFAITAAAQKSLLPCKAPSAEFAPDPALDPLWISYKEPFHGAAKKDFGFQVTIKVADDTPKEGDKKPDEGDKKPAEGDKAGAPANGKPAEGDKKPAAAAPRTPRTLPASVPLTPGAQPTVIPLAPDAPPMVVPPVYSPGVVR
ncbi:MAG: hypothetical protein ACJ786_40765, partial [Catenulispora sp.]